MTRPIIAAKTLNFSYGNTPILQDASLEIFPGEFVVIFGPNGGGKTTFLNLLLGFLKPSSGSLHLFNDLPYRSRKKMGYVPQKHTIDPLFPATMLDVVLMGCLSEVSPWGTLPVAWKNKGKTLLKALGLSEFENARFGTLSGGQAQRALIARALIHNPSILVLDEPTANVDASAESEILSTLLSFKGKKTIVLVTHHLQAVLTKADRLFCINKSISEYQSDQICDHFKLGLYHTQEVAKI
jgi:zinc transport system ATP-binding protein